MSRNRLRAVDRTSPTGSDETGDTERSNTMTDYNIPDSQAERYRLTATLLDIRAHQIDAGQDTTEVDKFLMAIVDAAVDA